MKLGVYLGERPESDLQAIFDFYHREVGNPTKGRQLVIALIEAME